MAKRKNHQRNRPRPDATYTNQPQPFDRVAAVKQFFHDSSAENDRGDQPQWQFLERGRAGTVSVAGEMSQRTDDYCRADSDDEAPQDGFPPARSAEPDRAHWQMLAAPNDHNESDCVQPDQRFF